MLGLVSRSLPSLVRSSIFRLLLKGAGGNPDKLNSRRGGVAFCAAWAGGSPESMPPRGGGGHGFLGDPASETSISSVWAAMKCNWDEACTRSGGAKLGRSASGSGTGISKAFACQPQFWEIWSFRFLRKRAARFRGGRRPYFPRGATCWLLGQLSAPIESMRVMRLPQTRKSTFPRGAGASRRAPELLDEVPSMRRRVSLRPSHRLRALYADCFLKHERPGVAPVCVDAGAPIWGGAFRRRRDSRKAA